MYLIGGRLNALLNLFIFGLKSLLIVIHTVSGQVCLVTMAGKSAGSDNNNNSTMNKRSTKNSLKVAAFENQNKILKQVLEASKALDKSNSGKDSAAVSELNSEGDVAMESEVGSQEKGGIETPKHKAQDRSGVPPAKKQKTGGNEVAPNSSGDIWKKGAILAYPGYEDMNAPGTSLNRSDIPVDRSGDDVEVEKAGNSGPPGEVVKTTMSSSTVAAESKRAANKMEDSYLFGDGEHQISDNSDDDMDFRGREENWDNMSMASSAIFPGSR